MADRTIQKAKAGVEDLLFGDGTVTQTRNATNIDITKINADKIPYSGDATTADVVTVKEQMIADKAELESDMLANYNALDADIVANYNEWKQYIVTDIEADVAAIGSTEITFVVLDTQVVSSNLVIPLNIELKFSKGGLLDISDGITVTVANVESCILAGNFTIFNLNTSGSLVFTKGGSIRLAWFGWSESATDSVNYIALSNAIDSAVNGGCSLYTGLGSFNIDFASGTLTIGNNNKLIGEGSTEDGTEIFITSDNDCFEIGSLKPQIRDIRFNTLDLGTYDSIVVNISVKPTTRNKILQDVVFWGSVGLSDGTAFRVNADGDSLTWITLDNVHVNGFTYGFYLWCPSDGSYINTLKMIDCSTFRTAYGYWEQIDVASGELGGITSCEIEYDSNSSGSDSISAIHSEGERNYYKLRIGDISAYTGDAIDLRGKASGGLDSTDRVASIVENRVAPYDMRRFCRCDDLAKYQWNDAMIRRDQFPWGYLIPVNWREIEDGTGTIAQVQDRVLEFATGTVSDDDCILRTENRIYKAKSQPWMTIKGAFAAAGDYANVFIEFGFIDGGNGYVFYFQADPTDVEGSGITSNWLSKIDTSAAANYTDTGVAFSTDTLRFDIYFTGSSSGACLECHMNIDGARVATQTLATAPDNLEPFIRVKTKTTAAKTFNIIEDFQIMYYRDMTA